MKSKMAIQNNFMQRISEEPFQTEPSRDPLITNQAKLLETYTEYKKCIHNILLNLQVHACYLIRLYRAGHISSSFFYDILKVIFPNRLLDSDMISSEAERVNYLLITVLKGIIDKEFERYDDISQVDLLAEDSLVGRIFKYIFRSQPVNIDSVASVVAHLLNWLMSEFKVA